MTVINKIFELTTNGDAEVVNITDQVLRIVRTSGLKDGLVNVFVPSSYIALTIIECESGLLGEFPKAFQNLKKFYEDDDIDSQIKSCVFNQSLTIPFCRGNVVTSTWQQIILIDFGYETRGQKITIQMIGE